MGDGGVLTKVAVEDVAPNELKYHSSCLIGFRRSFDDSEVNSKDTCNPPNTRSLEVLPQIEEDMCERRTCFPLQDLHQELSPRDKEYGLVRECNITRMRTAFLQRFPILKEETGSRNEVLLVTKEAMKNVVSSCLAFSSKDSYSCDLPNLLVSVEEKSNAFRLRKIIHCRLKSMISGRGAEKTQFLMHLSL